jgi:hypothetical protein
MLHSCGFNCHRYQVSANPYILRFMEEMYINDVIEDNVIYTDDINVHRGMQNNGRLFS